MKTTLSNPIKLLLMAIALVGASPAAHAQNATAGTPSVNTPATEVPPITFPEETPWQFGVTLPLWAPGIDGNVTLHGMQQDVNVSFDQIKDHLDASFALGLEVRKGNL